MDSFGVLGVCAKIRHEGLKGTQKRVKMGVSHAVNLCYTCYCQRMGFFSTLEKAGKISL